MLHAILPISYACKDYGKVLLYCQLYDYSSHWSLHGTIDIVILYVLFKFHINCREQSHSHQSHHHVPASFSNCLFDPHVYCTMYTLFSKKMKFFILQGARFGTRVLPRVCCLACLATTFVCFFPWYMVTILLLATSSYVPFVCV